MLKLQSTAGSHSKLFRQLFSAGKSKLSPDSNANAKSTLWPRHSFLIPPPTISDAIPSGGDIVAYTVKPTDTLMGLAITFNMKPEQIKQCNQLYSEHLLPGQVLYLRPPGSRTPPISNFRELRLQQKKKRSSTLEERHSKSGHGHVAPVSADTDSNNKKSTDDNNTTTTTLLSPRNSGDLDKIVPREYRSSGRFSLSTKTENANKEVVKQPARYCSESFNVQGTLTITEDVFVFEPKLEDPFVQKHGVLPYQLFINLKDIFDCQIVKENSKYLFDTSLEISCLESDGSAPTYDFILEEIILRNVYKQLMKWSSSKKEANEDEEASKASAPNSLSPPTSPHTTPIRQDLSALSISPPSVDDRDDSFVPNLDQPSVLLSTESIKKLVRHLPARYRFNNWKLLYGTQTHGISLNTFYTQTENKGPTIIVVEDKNKHIFGGFASESWRIEPRFYGTGESFLFKLKSPASTKSKAYHWTGKNNNFLCSRRDFIAMGGGNLFGFWLDSDFYNGSSYESDTFGSPPLAGSEDFIITVVEVWGVGGN